MYCYDAMQLLMWLTAISASINIAAGFYIVWQSRR